MVASDFELFAKVKHLVPDRSHCSYPPSVPCPRPHEPGERAKACLPDDTFSLRVSLIRLTKLKAHSVAEAFDHDTDVFRSDAEFENFHGSLYCFSF